MLNTSLGQFRLVAFLEGVSFLALLFVAMPAKYLLGIPEGVKWVGWAHGMLFLVYLASLARVASELRWPPLKVALALAASLAPFGTFWFDARLRRELAAAAVSQ